MTRVCTRPSRGSVDRGRLGPRHLCGWQANVSPGRLARPVVCGRGRLVETGRDTATSSIVDRSREVLSASGSDRPAFHTSAQLHAEEYRTLAAIACGGLGTNHLDGDTRLRTATAAETLDESFGSDGQPVPWSRILDRLAGEDLPRRLCMDPRTTEAARLPGNREGCTLPRGRARICRRRTGLLHLLVADGHGDQVHVDARSVNHQQGATIESPGSFSPRPRAVSGTPP